MKKFGRILVRRCFRSLSINSLKRGTSIPCAQSSGRFLSSFSWSRRVFKWYVASGYHPPLVFALKYFLSFLLQPPSPSMFFIICVSTWAVEICHKAVFGDGSFLTLGTSSMLVLVPMGTKGNGQVNAYVAKPWPPYFKGDSRPSFVRSVLDLILHSQVNDGLLHQVTQMTSDLAGIEMFCSRYLKFLETGFDDWHCVGRAGWRVSIRHKRDLAGPGVIYQSKIELVRVAYLQALVGGAFEYDSEIVALVFVVGGHLFQDVCNFFVHFLYNFDFLFHVDLYFFMNLV